PQLVATAAVRAYPPERAETWLANLAFLLHDLRLRDLTLREIPLWLRARRPGATYYLWLLGANLFVGLLAGAAAGFSGGLGTPGLWAPGVFLVVFAGTNGSVLWSFRPPRWWIGFILHGLFGTICGLAAGVLVSAPATGGLTGVLCGVLVGVTVRVTVGADVRRVPVSLRA